MVNVQFTVEEYDTLEKWYGLLFGGEISRHNMTDSDKKLYAKITMLHLAEVENQLRLKDLLKDDDD
jgi:hypothetical protein